jgi:hypothetical protein
MYRANEQMPEHSVQRGTIGDGSGFDGGCYAGRCSPYSVQSGVGIRALVVMPRRKSNQGCGTYMSPARASASYGYRVNTPWAVEPPHYGAVSRQLIAHLVPAFPPLPSKEFEIWACDGPLYQFINDLGLLAMPDAVAIYN